MTPDSSRTHPPPDSSLAPKAVALVLAAGAGERLGWSEPKAFVPLGGRLMVEYSLASISASVAVSSVVLVVPPAYLSRSRELATSLDPATAMTAIVAGGTTRQESVRLGLEALPDDVPVVVCHDAARPFATAMLFDRVVESLSGGKAAEGAVPVVPSRDTVKRVRAGLVVETIERAEVGLAQTPQAFLKEPLRKAHRRAARGGLFGTDDAMLMEEAGYRVLAVPGELLNFKVTTEADHRRAEQLFRDKRKAEALEPS